MFPLKDKNIMQNNGEFICRFHVSCINVKGSIIVMDSDNETDRTSPPEWESYIIPVFGAAIVILIFLVICQFYSETWRKYCCPRAVRNRIRSERRDRSSNARNAAEQCDLPPSYSALSRSQTNFDIFRVETMSISSQIPTSVIISANTDKLPSYNEILKEQERKEAERNRMNIESSIQRIDGYRTEDRAQSGHIDEISIYDLSEDESPPEYRPRTAR